jgi:hypothetical protein
VTLTSLPYGTGEMTLRDLIKLMSKEKVQMVVVLPSETLNIDLQLTIILATASQTDIITTSVQRILHI